jgi:hypothetical protein
VSEPLKQTLKVYQGQTFQFRFYVREEDETTAVNLTGYKARMQIRTELADDDVLLSLTTENSGISITAATGIVDLLISAADTAALDTDFDVAQWTYDLEIYNDTVSPVYVERIAEGAVVVFPEVTR